MKEHVLRFVGSVCLTILALIGIGAVLHILLTLPFEGKGPEWVGAIGTVATLIGTIWLATAERRRQTKQEADLAMLAAGSIFLKLARMAGAMKLVIKVLDREYPPDSRPPFQYCHQTLTNAPQWSNEELLPLVPLPNNTAARLALVMQVVILMSALCEKATRGHWDESDRREMVQHLEDALGVLDEAKRECRRVADPLHKSRPL
jgi:hypothetical protein